MISFNNVSYKYKRDSGVDDISLQIHPNEFAFLIGSTGSGKSTLLKLIYMDLLPTSGSLNILGTSSEKIKKRKIHLLRRKIGMIFQDYKLLNDRNIFENTKHNHTSYAHDIKDPSLKDVNKMMNEIDSINRQNMLIKRQNMLLMISIGILAVSIFL